MTFPARAGRRFLPFPAEGLPVPLTLSGGEAFQMVLGLIKLGTSADRVGAREA